MRPLLLCLSGVIGAATGLAALVVHRWTWGGIPVGLLLAAGATLAAAWWLAQFGGRSQLPAFAFGWLVPVVGGLLGRGEGDYAVAGDLSGYGLVGVALVLTVSALTAHRGRR
jgi:hypothetical protein